MRTEVNGINLPVRKTKGSCGYDFECPGNIVISAGKWKYIDLGVMMDKGDIPDGYVGMIVPRSSMGFKHGFRLRNTVGIIDSDYIGVSIKASVTADEDMVIKKGDRILQMIIVPFAIIPGEEVPTEDRVGGIGSTS